MNHVQLHCPGIGLRFVQGININVTGGRMTPGIEVYLGLRTDHHNTRIGRRMFPDVVSHRQRLNKRIIAINNLVDLNSRQGKEKAPLIKNAPAQDQREDQKMEEQGKELSELLEKRPSPALLQHRAVLSHVRL